MFLLGFCLGGICMAVAPWVAIVGFALASGLLQLAAIIWPETWGVWSWWGLPGWADRHRPPDEPGGPDRGAGF